MKYLQWLNGRKVAVSSLHVFGDLYYIDTSSAPPLQLAAVKNVLLEGTGQYFDLILQSCPNITSFELDGMSLSVEFTPAVVEMLPKLTTLLIRGSAISFHSLQAIGPQLKKLRHAGSLDTNRFALIATFPLLETLVLNWRIDDPAVIVNAINTCENLRDIHLWSCEFSEEDIAAILALNRLRRFTVDLISPSASCCQLLANLTSRFPTMEYLCFGSPGSCLHSLHEGRLELADYAVREINGTLLTQILDACSSVRFITIYEAVLQHDAVEVIERKLGSRLERLSMVIHHTPHVDNLQICGSLVHWLDLFCWGIADAVLGTIAAHCPLLESLHFKIMPPDSAIHLPLSTTDEGLGMVFSACRNLNELSLSHTVHMRITRKTLQTVLDHKLRLKTLNLYGTNCTNIEIDQHDVQWFRQQVREYLLPITVVTIARKSPVSYLR